MRDVILTNPVGLQCGEPSAPHLSSGHPGDFLGAALSGTVNGSQPIDEAIGRKHCQQPGRSILMYGPCTRERLRVALLALRLQQTFIPSMQIILSHPQCYPFHASV